MDHGILLSILEKSFGVTGQCYFQLSPEGNPPQNPKSPPPPDKHPKYKKHLKCIEFTPQICVSPQNLESRINTGYWYSPGLDTIIPGWTFSNLPDRPDRARQIQRRDRVFRSASGYNPRSTVLHRLYSRDRNHHRETRCQDASLRRRHPAVRSLTGQQPLSDRWQPWRPVCRHRPVEQSASTQTQPFQNRTHLVGLSALNRKAPTTTADPSQLPRIVKLSIGPRFGVIIDSGLTLTTHVSILARTCFYQLRRIRQAKKNLDEDAVKTLVHALDNLSSHAWTTATRYWPTCQK